MKIKKILVLLLFMVAIIGIMAPIHAKSSNNKVEIKWDANGGKIGSKKIVTTTVKKGSKIGTLKKATRTGYTLKGWYTKKTGGTKITVNTKPEKSVTYYAQWESTSKKNDKTKTEKELNAIKKKIVGTWKYKKGGDFGELTLKSGGSFTFHTLNSIDEGYREVKLTGKYSVNHYSSSKKTYTYIKVTGKETDRYQEHGEEWTSWITHDNTAGRVFEYIIKNGKQNILHKADTNNYYQKS